MGSFHAVGRAVAGSQGPRVPSPSLLTLRPWTQYMTVLHFPTIKIGTTNCPLFLKVAPVDQTAKECIPMTENNAIITRSTRGCAPSEASAEKATQEVRQARRDV